MKKIIGIIAAVLSLSAGAQTIDIPVPPVVVSHTASVLSIKFTTPSISEAVAAVRFPDGTYGRRVSSKNVSVQFKDSSTNALPDEEFYTPFKEDILITSSNLVAAGAAIGKSWASAKGDDELAITLMAIVQELGNRAVPNQSIRASWVMSTFSAILTKIQSGQL